MGEETKIFSSSARRTRETARFIFDDQQEILFFDELYLVGKDDLMAFISNREEVKEILIIGHNFGISSLHRIIQVNKYSSKLEVLSVLIFQTFP